MNYKIVLGIIDVAIVVGGIIYFVSKDKVKKPTESEFEHKVDEKKNAEIIEDTKTTEEAAEIDLNAVKSDSAEKMKERHEEAEKMMRESVDNIFNESEVGETKNEEAKKKLFEDLNNI